MITAKTSKEFREQARKLYDYGLYDEKPIWECLTKKECVYYGKLIGKEE
jgi:hypothetical protein